MRMFIRKVMCYIGIFLFVFGASSIDNECLWIPMSITALGLIIAYANFDAIWHSKWDMLL